MSIVCVRFGGGGGGGGGGGNERHSSVNIPLVGVKIAALGCQVKERRRTSTNHSPHSLHIQTKGLRGKQQYNVNSMMLVCVCSGW